MKNIRKSIAALLLLATIVAGGTRIKRSVEIDPPTPPTIQTISQR